MIYILYNPLASCGQGETFAKEVQSAQTAPTELRSVIDLDAKAFVSACTAEDKIILCGGDGTLNIFANDTYGVDYPCEIFLYKSGTGNDFLRDVEDKEKDNMLLLNDYIKNLPTVTVGGKKYEFKKVWLASGMNGGYYGGGMNVAPNQDRLGDTLTSCIIHGSGKLKTLIVFPSLFKGEHIKHKEMTEILTGKEITVEFTIPTALQIDGETVLGVTSYTIRK